MGVEIKSEESMEMSEYQWEVMGVQKWEVRRGQV